MTPEISVIIPVYMMEKYLGACLESVLNQTFKDFEVVCVNDGSTDKSLEIINSYAQKDSRVRVIDQKNQGGSVARNNALDAAKGDYICFLDNDDLYYPQYLEILYNLCTAYNADVSACKYGVFFDDDAPELKLYDLKRPKKPKVVSEKPFYDYVVKRKKIPMLMWTKLYKKEVLDNIRFSPRLPAINDVLFHLEVLKASKKLVTIPYTLVTHRMIASAQSSQKLTLKKVEEFEALQELMAESVLSRLTDEKEIKSFRRMMTKTAYFNFVYGVMKFNPVREKDDIFEKIKECLGRFEEQNLFTPRLLKIQDFLVYKAFIAGRFGLCLKALRVREFITRVK